MQAQELFDQVVTHLRVQGKKATDTTGCMYRGPEGTSCAAGCLITDEEYNPDMERTNIRGILGASSTPISLKERLLPHVELLNELQNVHDNYPPNKWEARWQQVAHKYLLAYTPKGE